MSKRDYRDWEVLPNSVGPALKSTRTIDALKVRGVWKAYFKPDAYLRERYVLRWHLQGDARTCIAECHQPGWASCGYATQREAIAAAKELGGQG